MIIANDRLIEYLSGEIDSLSEILHLKFASMIDSNLLLWTESKVSLVEFIYALYEIISFLSGKEPHKYKVKNGDIILIDRKHFSYFD